MENHGKKIRTLCIYGNPKKGGFVHGCIDHVASQLEGKGVEIDKLALNDCEIRNCTGCFSCLRTGKCTLDDDMDKIIEQIRLADGIVAGASVRNSYFPALFKTFYERITYICGFGRDLYEKYVLGIGAVGFASGKKHLGKLITFREFHTYISDYLFFRTGIPTKIVVEDISSKLDRAGEKFHHAVGNKFPLPLTTRLMSELDNYIIRKFMLDRNFDHTYDYVIDQWKKKGLM